MKGRKRRRTAKGPHPQDAADTAVKEDFTQSLPDEILLMVFFMLPMADLLSICDVSARWRRLAKDRKLWDFRIVTVLRNYGCVDPIVLGKILRKAPCLYALRVESLKTPLPQPHSAFKVNYLDIQWKPSKASLNLLRNFSECYVDNLTILDTPRHKSRLTEDLWAEVENISLKLNGLILRKATLPSSNLSPGTSYMFSSGTNTLEKLVVFRELGLPESFVGSLIQAHRNSLQSIGVLAVPEDPKLLMSDWVWSKVIYCYNVKGLVLRNITLHEKHSPPSHPLYKLLKELHSLRKRGYYLSNLRQLTFSWQGSSYIGIDTFYREVVECLGSEEDHQIHDLHLSVKDFTYNGRFSKGFHCCEKSVHVFNEEIFDV